MLVRAFRSLVLPLQAVLLDLLSVAAAYGLLALVVEHGVGAQLLGIEQSGAVEAWVPIALFAFLFGLSMDYEVFIVMPMREAWDEGADRAAAVAHGLMRTGRIVTVAAAIMVAVFSGFVAGTRAGPPAVRARPRARHPDRRHDRAPRRRAVARLPGRTAQLLAAPPSGEARARRAVAPAGREQHGGRARGRDLRRSWRRVRQSTTVIASLNAGNWYPSAKPGASVA